MRMGHRGPQGPHFLLEMEIALVAAQRLAGALCSFQYQPADHLPAALGEREGGGGGSSQEAGRSGSVECTHMGKWNRNSGLCEGLWLRAEAS